LLHIGAAREPFSQPKACVGMDSLEGLITWNYYIGSKLGTVSSRRRLENHPSKS